MNAIVAVDNNWGIGKNNGLLFHIPTDMDFFKKKTLNKVIVMGSNTLLSFPNSKPLKNRTNIVLFPGGKRDDCIVAQSLDELKLILKKYNSDDIYVVGGAMFYKTMLDYCSKVFVTKVDSDGAATVFFENLDKRKNWILFDKQNSIEADGYNISFNEYKNLDVKEFN